MNKKINLLDCTLRDGGYLNDWNFGADNIVSVFERLVSAGVDIIEVGFLDERRGFDPNRTIQPDTAAVNKQFGKMSRGRATTVAMIDFGTCDIKNIMPCEDCWLDGIRVIFKKEKQRPALDFCRQIKDLGYQVFVQAVSITSYSEDDLRELAAGVNAFEPHALSMVDTYGLLEPDSLIKIAKLLDEAVKPNIVLGFHAHNNFQLGYANAIALMNAGLKHNLVIDGTLYGMGKSAGNAPIELIAMKLNTMFGKTYDIEQLQEAISTCVLDMYNRQPWGYTLFYYIAARNSCHPDYVSYLMSKRTLSITAINEILSQIPAEKKLGKDMKMLEQLYLEYQKCECSDEETISALTAVLSGRKVLAIGPGHSMVTKQEDIKRCIEHENPVVIPVNYIPHDIKPDYLFLTNSKRYLGLAGMLLDPEIEDIPIIATSNVRKTDGEFPYVLNFSSLIDETAEYPDNSMVMLLRLLQKIGVSTIYMAGFDGYTMDNLNYLDASMEYDFVKNKAQSLNRYAIAFLKTYSKNTEIKFVTPSQYCIEGGF